MIGARKENAKESVTDAEPVVMFSCRCCGMKPAKKDNGQVIWLECACGWRTAGWPTIQDAQYDWQRIMYDPHWDDYKKHNAPLQVLERSDNNLQAEVRQ